MRLSSAIKCWLATLLPRVAAHPTYQVPAASTNDTQSFSTTTIPHHQGVPYGSIINACTVPGKVALTYDDGPGLYTEELLDILKANKVKATFFIAGNAGNAASGGPITEQGNVKILQRMHASGHHIASHTWTHPDLAFLDTEGRRHEMAQNEEAFSHALGFVPTYMRPPYASCPVDCVEDMESFGYHVVNMNLDTKDYRRDYSFSREVYSSALSSREPKDVGFIVLAHDIHPETVHTFTQYMIDTAKGLGYDLVTLGECLGDPAENWYAPS